MSVTRRDLILEAEVITRLSAPRAGRAGKRVVYAYRTHTTRISVCLAGLFAPSPRLDDLLVLQAGRLAGR